MKILLLFLISFLTFSSYAGEEPHNNALIIFQKLCESEQDPKLRQKYCYQVENIKKSERIIYGLQEQRKQG